MNEFIIGFLTKCAEIEKEAILIDNVDYSPIRDFKKITKSVEDMQALPRYQSERLYENIDDSETQNNIKKVLGNEKGTEFINKVMELRQIAGLSKEWKIFFTTQLFSNYTGGFIDSRLSSVLKDYMNNILTNKYEKNIVINALDPSLVAHEIGHAKNLQESNPNIRLSALRRILMGITPLIGLGTGFIAGRSNMSPLKKALLTLSPTVISMLTSHPEIKEEMIASEFANKQIPDEETKQFLDRALSTYKAQIYATPLASAVGFGAGTSEKYLENLAINALRRIKK